MKTIVDGYKEAIKENGREIDAKITYTLNGNEVELGGEQLNSLTPHYEGGILKSVMKQLDIDSNEDIPLETQINAQFGLKVNDEYKYINLGDYIVYSSEKQEDTRSYKIIAYDKLLYSMKPYERLTTKNLLDTTKMVTFQGPVASRWWWIDGIYATDESTLYYEVKAGQRYTISIHDKANVTKVQGIYKINGVESQAFLIENDNTSTSFTPSVTTKMYVRVNITSANTDTYCIVQLEEGPSATSYTDHYVQYPITIREYLKAICYQLGIDFANASDTFVNYDKEIESELYLDSEGYSLDFTYRDVLDQLAQVTASTICINDDNELEVRYINDTQGKNLMKVDSNLTTSTMGGITFTPIYENGCLIRVDVSGTSNARAYYYLQNGIRDFGGLQGNITISTQGTDTGVNLHQDNYTNGSWQAGKIVSGSVSETYNPTSLGYTHYRNYINVPFTTPKTYNTSVYPMFEKGDKVTFYAPYGRDCIDEEYLKDINVNFGEKYGPINTITFKRSAGSDMISRSIPKDLSDDLKNEIAIEDNEILNGNDRDEFIDGILNKLYGLEYYINDYSSTGITYYDLCDRYNVKVDDKFYSCIMFNDEIEITQGLVENIHTDKPEDSETDYSKTSKTDRTLKQAYIMVDKANQTIDSFTGQVTDLQSLVDSQGEQITELGVRVTQNESSWQTSISSIQGQLANGVSLVKTTSVIINNEGLNVSDDTSKIQTTMTTNAFKITPKGDSETLLAFIGYDEEQGTSVAKMDNLTITNYFTSGYHRTEGVEDMENARGDTEDRTCVFYIGG